MSPPGRPKGEYRSAQREGGPASPPGRPKGEYRSAQREGGRAIGICAPFARGVLLVLGMLACADAALGATYIVDDSSTLPFETQVNTRWRDGVAGGRQMSNEIEGGATVTIRLNTQPWLNRNGRIYLVLPQQPIGVVNVEWATQGRLLPGKLQSGDRTLVYAGPIRSNAIEDNFTVRVVADGRRVLSAQRLKFHFEIDVD